MCSFTVWYHRDFELLLVHIRVRYPYPIERVYRTTPLQKEKPRGTLHLPHQSLVCMRDVTHTPTLGRAVMREPRLSDPRRLGWIPHLFGISLQLPAALSHLRKATLMVTSIDR